MLCLDKLGYVQIDPRGAELLFQIITEREERASVAIATNLPFSNGRDPRRLHRRRRHARPPAAPLRGHQPRRRVLPPPRPPRRRRNPAPNHHRQPPSDAVTRPLGIDFLVSTPAAFQLNPKIGSPGCGLTQKALAAGADAANAPHTWPPTQSWHHRRFANSLGRSAREL
ncbi:MAG: ATP-binding protein [Actinobacteria bacterium]|nr:ATP-binding protein [Actinomycetota bacterium]